MDLTPARKTATLGNFSLRRKDKIYGFLLTLPALLIVFGLIFYPLGLGIINSFRKINLFNMAESTWVGFDNYRILFRYNLFWQSVQNTLVYTIGSTLGAALVGLLLALLLNKQTRTNRLHRGFFLIPWILPGVVVAYMFSFMFGESNGIVGYVLTVIGLLEKSINFFADMDTAMPAVIIATIWLSFPFAMIMYLAGLKTIPKEIEEAAWVDGANLFQRFWYITLPYLKNIIVITTTLMVIWNFNFMDLIYTTTRGGPVNSTEILAIFAYRTAIQQLNFGLTSALGVLWLLALTGFAYLYLRNMKVLGD